MEPFTLGLIAFLAQLRPLEAVRDLAGDTANNAAKKGIEHGYRAVLGRLQKRALEGDMPPAERHELERALCNALSNAAVLFAYTIHNPERRLLKDVVHENVSWSALGQLKNRLGEIARGNIAIKTPQDRWIHEVIEKARKPENFKDLTLPSEILADGTLSLLNPAVENVLADQILAAFLKWLPATGVPLSPLSKPADFDDSIRRGITLSNGRSLTFYDAFRLFFREELIGSTAAHRACVIDALAALGSDVAAIASTITTAAERQQFIDAIEALKDFDRLRQQLEDWNLNLLQNVSSVQAQLDYVIGGMPIVKFRTTTANRGDELLKARSRSVTLVGRRPERDSLWAWVTEPATVSAQLIVGGAGSGKTRLAFELLALMERRLPWWQAGLLKGDALRNFVAVKQPGDLRWTSPTLVVVDYAQAVRGPLSKLLIELTPHRSSRSLPPLRILLLERQAGEWIDELRNEEDSSSEPIRTLFGPDIVLESIGDVSLRRHLFDETVAQAARIAGKPLPTAYPNDYRKLERDTFGRPLNVMLAAVAAVDFDLGVEIALERNPIDLANHVAEKELRRIDRFAPEPDNEQQEFVLRHMAACATLESGYTTTHELQRAVHDEISALRRDWDGGEGALEEILRNVLHDDNRAVAPVEPDFVGEALMLRVLARRDERERWREVVQRCGSRAPDKTPYTLLHAFQNFGGSPESSGALLEAIDALIKAALSGGESHILAGIERVLPQETVALGVRAVEVTRRLYERLKNKLENGDSRLEPDCARIAYNLAIRLYQQGRSGEALTAAEEAVARYDALARRSPAFEPHFAGSLTHLAVCLAGVGRASEALEQGRRAVDIYRRHLPTKLHEIGPDLARALENVSNHAVAAGRDAEAFELAKEAMTLYEGFPEGLRDHLEPDLARSSGNFSDRLSAAGRRAEALAYAEKSVSIYHRLADRYPDGRHQIGIAFCMESV
jgi:tetratricopeptide (TPR) repeat protein